MLIPEKFGFSFLPLSFFKINVYVDIKTPISESSPDLHLSTMYDPVFTMLSSLHPLKQLRACEPCFFFLNKIVFYVNIKKGKNYYPDLTN